jgi:hypothetical protein
MRFQKKKNETKQKSQNRKISKTLRVLTYEMSRLVPLLSICMRHGSLALSRIIQLASLISLCLWDWTTRSLKEKGSCKRYMEESLHYALTSSSVGKVPLLYEYSTPLNSIVWSPSKLISSLASYMHVRPPVLLYFYMRREPSSLALWDRVRAVGSGS